MGIKNAKKLMTIASPLPHPPGFFASLQRVPIISDLRYIRFSLAKITDQKAVEDEVDFT
jgi:hypothetical protein